MAPKAKQTPAQPKAKAEPKAEPKAKAKAKPEPSPPAPAAPEPKPEAKAKAKGKAKAQPESSPAQVPAAKSEPKAKAKGGAKSQPAPAPAPAAKAPEQPQAKSKSKAKGKAKAEPAPPPPPPEPEPVEEPEKKKKTRRGGGNKNKEVTGSFPGEEIPSGSPVAAPKKQGKSAADIAAGNAEKDEELRALRSRYAALTKLTTSELRAKKSDIDGLISDIDKEMANKRVPAGKHASSLQLLQSLDDLKKMKSDEATAMIEEVEKELAEARAAELWNALKSRFNDLKTQADFLIKSLSSAPAAAAAKGPSADGAALAAAREQREVDNREATVLRRLSNLHKKDPKDVTASMIETRNLELDMGITKYLFTPPHSFSSRFELQFKVLVEPKRTDGAKGGGKGGKGAPPPKDLVITGLSKDEVAACEAALKALDLSGVKTRDIENGFVMPNNSQKAAIEKEFDVIVFKAGNQVSIFGKVSNASAALTKLEDQGFSKTLTASADLIKMIYTNNLLPEWRGQSPGANISINQPGGEKGEGKGNRNQPGQITVHCKSKQETEDLFAKIEHWTATTASEVLTADEEVVKKLFERSNGSWLAKAFRKIQDSSSDISLRKVQDNAGVLLLGPKKQLAKVKAELQELLKQANVEPEKVTLDGDQARVFSKDTMDRIRDNCGLMEMYKSREPNPEGDRIDHIVMLGGADAVAKAKAEIQTVIKNEGTSDALEGVTDQVCKELLANKAAKIQDYQNKYSTYIQVDRKTSTIKILGSAAGVESTKKAITAFAKKTDSIIVKKLPIEEEQIGRIIGSKGSTMKKMESECKVQISIDKNVPSVEIRGDEKGIAEAEQMIAEILGKVDATPDAEPKAKASSKPKEEPAAAEPEVKKPKAKAKAKEFQGDMTQDFPTLGAAPKAKAAAKAWGKNAAEDEEKGDADE